MAEGICTIPECGKPKKTRGLCQMHYSRLRRHGDPNTMNALRFPCSRDGDRYHACDDATRRFWAKVNKTDTCWLWTAATVLDGYGHFSAHRDFPAARAHRYAYTLLVGPVADDLALDHLCRVRNCVNPAHLEPVTNEENVRRGIAIGYDHPNAPTTCGQGHDPSRYHWVPSNRRSGPEFRCRTCDNERTARWRATNQPPRPPRVLNCDRKCIAAECENAVCARDLCNKHYLRQRRPAA